MKRELKFRAWHLPSKTMYWFDILDGMKHGTGGGYIPMAPIGEENTIRIHKDNLCPVDPMDCELMQLTGLVDINGRNIYECDLVKCAGGTLKAEVVWHNGAWCLETYNENTRQNPLEMYYFHEAEVIGNVFENAELLPVQPISEQMCGDGG
jgi:uncharacterized phage protein (TIGR01671 family)